MTQMTQMNEDDFTLTGSDGMSIRGYRWSGGDAPRAIINLAHGMGEHAARYRRFAQVLVDAGYIVYANDHRGHGRTAGGAEHHGDMGTANWRGLVDELGALNRHARAEHPDTPLVMFGHSMGSFALQQYLVEHSDDADVAILCGTSAIDVIGAGIDPDAEVDLSAFNAPFEPAPTEYEWLSRDRAEVDAYVADDACGFGINAAAARAMLEGTVVAGDPATIAQVRSDLPIYVMSGDADPLAGGGELIELVAQRYRDAGVSDVTVARYPDARHEILNETNRDEVTADVLAWLDGVLEEPHHMTDTQQPTAQAPPSAAAFEFDAEQIVNQVRAGFERGITRPLEWRRNQLDAMEEMLRENADQLLAALAADLHKPATEAWTTEIGFTLADIDHQKSNLEKWSEPRKVSVPLAYQPATARIVPEPKGVVLVIAPWNYPLQLLLSPMAAAIAAGNAIVAKPSELAPATSDALVELCARYLDPATISVVGGGVDESSALLEQRFDHIFFTGGTRVGKIVMHAAAEHLTPVTLELGGKSPAIVAADADVEVTARRIAWGKFVNSGQTCIAPDYVLVARPLRGQLVAAIEKSVKEFYGSDPHTSDDYGRIISDDHFERITALIGAPGSGTIAFGGVTDPADRYISPTVLTDPDVDSDVMSEEIFGPVLPVIAVDTVDDAIDFVNAREKPLALYVFTEDDATAQRTVARTSSGGVSVNGTLLHIGPPDLPFGGVGPSGMGAYHGEAGFETFSHLKSVFNKRTKPDFKVLYPPYTNMKERLIKFLQ